MVLSGYLLFARLNDGKKLLTLIKQAKLGYFLLALVFQVIYYTFYTFLYQKSFSINGIKWRFKQMISLVFASISISLITPLGSLAGAGVFIHKAKQQGISASTVIISLFLATLMDFFGLFVFLTSSIIFLIFKHNILKYEIMGYLTFIVMFAGIISMLVLGYRNQKTLKMTLRFLQIAVNKAGILIRKKGFLPKVWFENKAREMEEISKRLVREKRRFRYLVFNSLIMHSADIASMFLLFLAFGKLVHIDVLLIGYSIGVLFWIVTPIPQGVGVVESVMPVVFSSLGVDIGTATLVTLSFRGITLWIPAILGYVTLTNGTLKGGILIGETQD